MPPGNIRKKEGAADFLVRFWQSGELPLRVFRKIGILCVSDTRPIPSGIPQKMRTTMKPMNVPFFPSGFGSSAFARLQSAVGFRVILTGLHVAISGGGTVRAADVIKAASGTDLTDGVSWGGSVPTAADTATWQSTSLGAGLTLGSAASWGGIRVTGADSAIGITGGGTLTLGTGGIDTQGSGRNLSISNSIVLNGAQSWIADGGTAMNISGTVSGTGPLTLGYAAPILTFSSYLTAGTTTIFNNVSLADVSATSGLMGGGFVAGGGGNYLASPGFAFVNNGSIATYQMRVLDGGFTKAVGIQLAQSGNDITGQVLYAKFISGSNLNNDFNVTGNSSSIATSNVAPGYGAASTSIKVGEDGDGTITLSGVNSYSGGTTINAGNVIATQGVAFNGTQGGSFGSGSVTINAGAKVTTSGNFILGGGNITTRTVNINGGTADITAAALGGEYFRTLNLTGGSVIRTNTTTYFRAPNGGFNINSLAAPASSTISTGIDMTFSSMAVNVADGTAVNDLVISGNITQNTGAGSGAKSITKSGTGTLLLSGSNSFTGGVTVNEGTVKLGNQNALGGYLTGRPVSQVTVASGGAIDFNGILDATYGYTIAGSGVGGTGALTNTGGGIGNGTAQASNIALSADASIGGSGNWALLTNGFGATNVNLQGYTLTKVGSNTISLTSATVTAGTLQINAGTLGLGVDIGGGGVNAAAAALSFANTSGAGVSVIRNSSVGSLAGGGTTGGSLNLNGNVLTIGALNADTSYAGVISGSGGSLLKTGTGVQTLAGNSTFTGGTTIEAGGMAAATNSAFGTGAITLGTGAANVSLFLANRSDINNAITVSAAGSGAVIIGANNTGSGANPATLLGTLTLNRPTTFSSEIPNERFSVEGKITGNVGTLTVTGGSRTTLSSTANDFTGNLLVTGAGTILQIGVATAAGVVPDGTSITVDAGAVFQLAVSGSGTEAINSLNGNGTVRTFAGQAFPGTLAVGAGGGSGDFGGALVNGDGALALTKLGSGTQTLSGASTYTGATLVSAGTLLVNGSLGSTPVTVSSGATIGGTGSLAGSLGLDASAIFEVVDFNNPLSVAGTITFGSGFGIANLAGIDWDSLALDTAHSLIATSQTFGSGDIANFGLANATAVGTGRLAYFENGSLAVIVIPEPGTPMLGAIAALFLLRRRR
jgi:autotransporter-associated beta strand protein